MRYVVWYWHDNKITASTPTADFMEAIDFYAKCGAKAYCIGETWDNTW